MTYQCVAKATLPTAYGMFDIHSFEDQEPNVALAGHKTEHVLLSVGLPDINKVPLVRIHSECLTGDAFKSLKCECGPQLNHAMQLIQQEGCGAILYLRQEGRGIGLTNKIRAYALQDQGHDTVDANLLLGLPADGRRYDMCYPMLSHIGVTKMRLLTNNPQKLACFDNLDIDIVEQVPLLVGINPYNQDYLRTKRDRMGHIIDVKL